jgi:hypothetical protein
MNKSAADKTIVLVTRGNSRGPEDKIINDFWVVKTGYRNNTGQNDNAYG